MNDNLTLKKIHRDEISMVQKVYNGTRNTSLDKTFFLDKFESNSINKFISLVFFDGEKPVSHCAVVPVNMSNNFEDPIKFVAGQVCEAVTIPEYQRRGLFNKINLKINEKAEEELISLLFRFPSSHNFKRVINNFEFEHIENFKEFEFEFKVFIPYLKILQKFKLHKLIKTYFKTLSILTFSKNKIIGNSLIRQGFYSVPHTKEYFDYKKCNDNFRINIFGDNYWVKQEDGFSVGDFNIKSKTNFFKKMKWFCFLFGIHKVRFFVCENTEEYDLLKNYQNPKDGIPICVKNIGENKIESKKIKFTFAELDTF